MDLIAEKALENYNEMQQARKDAMREENNEYFIASFSDDAEDVLHIVRETMPDKRKAFKDDLESAANFIALALKDCQ
jgi:hypothetical protein